MAQNFEFKTNNCPDLCFYKSTSFFEDLKQVSADWKFDTFGPLLNVKYGKRLELVKTSRFHLKPLLKKILSQMSTLINIYTKALSKNKNENNHCMVDLSKSPEA